MIRVFAVCGVGLGVSAVMRSRIQEALDAQGVSYDLGIIDASAASGQEADLIFTSDELTDRLRNGSARVVAIQNFTSRSEVREKVAGALSEMGPEART